MKPVAQISQAETKRLQERLERLERQENIKDLPEVLLDNASFQQHFKITRRTAYNWRKKQLLKSVLIEKKVFYRLSDIRKFLEELKDR